MRKAVTLRLELRHNGFVVGLPDLSDDTVVAVRKCEKIERKTERKTATAVAKPPRAGSPASPLHSL